LWLPGAVSLANLLLISFFGALLFNLARGLDVYCGCFGTSTHGSPTMLWYVLRDGLFLLLGAYTFFNVMIKKTKYREFGRRKAGLRR